MSKSRHPKPHETLPEPREPSLRELPTGTEVEDFSHVPEEHVEEHVPHEEHYDENGQPYAAAEHAEHEQAYVEDEQHYDENGQPYYDENGQPYYDENGQPYDPNAYPQDYATAPMEQMPGPPQMHLHDPRHVPMNLPQPHVQLHSHPPGVPIPAPPPSSHGGPYRMLPGEAPVFQGFPQARPPRPILGSALAIYGVLLWSFVVAGQFATSWIEGAPMSQGTAGFLVFLATGAAWGFALHRSRYVLPSVKMARFIWRGIGIGALAFVMFVFTLILATIYGQSTRGHDFFIAFVLVATSLAAIIVGPRLTLPKGQAQAKTHRAKFAVVSVWVVGVILTLVAGAELATNG